MSVCEGNSADDSQTCDLSSEATDSYCAQGMIKARKEGPAPLLPVNAPLYASGLGLFL